MPLSQSCAHSFCQVLVLLQHATIVQVSLGWKVFLDQLKGVITPRQPVVLVNGAPDLILDRGQAVRLV